MKAYEKQCVEDAVRRFTLDPDEAAACSVIRDALVYEVYHQKESLDDFFFWLLSTCAECAWCDIVCAVWEYANERSRSVERSKEARRSHGQRHLPPATTVVVTKARIALSSSVFRDIQRWARQELRRAEYRLKVSKTH